MPARSAALKTSVTNRGAESRQSLSIQDGARGRKPAVSIEAVLYWLSQQPMGFGVFVAAVAVALVIAIMSIRPDGP